MKIRHLALSLATAALLTACSNAPREESKPVATLAPTPAATATPTAQPATPAAAAPRAPRTPLVTKVYNFNELPVQNPAPGPRRALFDNPTPTLSNLECHITTLTKPGDAAHAPHRHPHEEMMLVKEGNLEAIINGVVIPMPTGSVLFVAPNDLHGLRNAGPGPATYFVLTWRTPLTATPDTTTIPTPIPAAAARP